MLKGFKERLIELMGGVPQIKEEIFNINPGTEKGVREAFNRLPDDFKKMLAQTMARNVMLEKENKELVSLADEAKEFKKVIKAAEEHEIKQKKLEIHKKIYLYLQMDKLPRIYLKNDTPHPKISDHPYLLGFQVSGLQSGGFEWKPVLTNEKKDSVLLLTKGCFDFREMFGNELNIPSQMNNGLFKCNFDFDNKGKLFLHSNEYISKSTDETCKIIDISAVERKNYQDVIHGLNDSIKKFAGMANQAYEREEKYKQD